MQPPNGQSIWLRLLGVAMREREWDIRLVWNQREQRWWWNAWRERTATELWGFADDEAAAYAAMTEAIEKAERETVASPKAW
jgi:hypothetical protein